MRFYLVLIFHSSIFSRRKMGSWAGGKIKIVAVTNFGKSRKIVSYCCVNWPNEFWAVRSHMVAGWSLLYHVWRWTRFFCDHIGTALPHLQRIPDKLGPNHLRCDYYLKNTRIILVLKFSLYQCSGKWDLQIFMTHTSTFINQAEMYDSTFTWITTTIGIFIYRFYYNTPNDFDKHWLRKICKNEVLPRPRSRWRKSNWNSTSFSVYCFKYIDVFWSIANCMTPKRPLSGHTFSKASFS